MGVRIKRQHYMVQWIVDLWILAWMYQLRTQKSSESCCNSHHRFSRTLEVGLAAHLDLARYQYRHCLFTHRIPFVALAGEHDDLAPCLVGLHHAVGLGSLVDAENAPDRHRQCAGRHVVEKLLQRHAHEV